MSTLTQLRADFRRSARFEQQTDVDAPPLLKADITRYLNLARHRRWARLGARLPEQLLTRGTMTYTANTEAVALPAAMAARMIRSVDYVTVTGSTDPANREELCPEEMDQLDAYTGYGVPLAWCVDFAAQAMMLRPIPQSDATIHVRYHAALTDLSADGNIPTELPSEYHQVYVEDALGAYFEDVENPEAATRRARADRLWEDVERYFNQMFPGGDGYKHRAERAQNSWRR